MRAPSASSAATAAPCGSTLASYDALVAAGGACKADSDCECFNGGVSQKTPCGVHVHPGVHRGPLRQQSSIRRLGCCDTTPVNRAHVADAKRKLERSGRPYCPPKSACGPGADGTWAGAPGKCTAGNCGLRSM